MNSTWLRAQDEYLEPEWDEEPETGEDDPYDPDDWAC